MLSALPASPPVRSTRKKDLGDLAHPTEAANPRVHRDELPCWQEEEL